MNRKLSKRILALILMVVVEVSAAACGSAKRTEGLNEEGEAISGVKKMPKESHINTSGSFKEVHDAFTTTLDREEHDDDPIPEPPEGLFDLVYYPSKAGDLAAYVSCDPDDGEKHPLIIWVVGGWGNGIDDFPFTYPEWDNDQTGSAFWQNGILTMYPSFRGGNGNPGYYETLFGEVDDIVSAYEYAASLPYVDPQRIYLGGHSTGGTRALLAAEYTDQFRAVFCFGAVDEIKYHNNSQFTFDTGNKDEYIMRSPVYWLNDIGSPVFLIEGREGNSENLERMERSCQNDMLHCFVVENADHFSVLAPATGVVAQKILTDTGAEADIEITQGELDEALKRGRTEMPAPVMTKRYIEELGMTFSCPYIWEIMYNEAGDGFDIYSRYEEANAWDMAGVYITVYQSPDGGIQYLKENVENNGYQVSERMISGKPAVEGNAVFQEEDGNACYRRCLFIENGEIGVLFEFAIYEEYMEEMKPVFQGIVDSISFDA